MKTRFGEMVGRARRARRITLKELGTAIGLGASIISEMEHGHRLPPADATVLEKFAKFLGLDFPELQERARIERKARKASVESRLFEINPELACGFAREVEGLDDAELSEFLATALDSLKKKRSGGVDG